MKKILKIFLIGIFVKIAVTFAFAQQQPAGFIVQVEPSSFDVNVAVDVTIKAVRSNGDIIKDYEGDVWIDVEGDIDLSEYTVPSQGFYTFLPQDQGVKIFSKGLIIKKSGTFTLSASEMEDESVRGEKTIIVGTTHAVAAKPITINSPSNNGIEKTEIVEVIGGSSDLPNSPFEIYLNNQLANEGGITSSVGGFTAYITGLKNGENTLYVKILDINDVILGESETITFNYLPITDGVFESIQVLPSNSIKAGTKATFRVSTSDSVTSATIILSNGRSAPMDLLSAGIFSKEITIDSEGKIDISLDLFVDGNKNEYQNVSRLLVEKGTAIEKVRIFGDPAYKDKMTITRDLVGVEPAKYSIAFGTDKDYLSESAVVTKKEIILEDLTIGQTYYFRITPLDINGEVAGSPSDIINAVAGDISENSCTVQGIVVSDTTIGDKHYLTRNEVKNVEKYIIYRSDQQTSDVSRMQKVIETQETRFEYPFNKNAKQEKYAYYAVQAICKDGKALVIEDIKKVQTGPMENFLLLVFVATLLYGSYRLVFIQK